MRQRVHSGCEDRRVVGSGQSLQWWLPAEEQGIACQALSGAGTDDNNRSTSPGFAEVPGAQNDKMVQTLPANGTDQALSVRVLPRALRCGEHLGHAQCGDLGTDFDSVKCYPGRGQGIGLVAIGKGFDNLLRGPGGGRMFGDGKVQYLATAVLQHEEHEQHSHADRGHGEEVNRDHLANMVVKEGLPRLTGRSRKAAQNSGHGARGDHDAEHFQFTVDSRCTPQRIGSHHLLDQPTNVAGDRRTTRATTWLGQSHPESPVALALPAGDGVSLDIEQRAAPARPPAAQSDPKRAVKLVDDLAGESPASADCQVGTVVISGDGAGDQTVESPEVNVLVGRVQTWSAPTGGLAKQQVVAQSNSRKAPKTLLHENRSVKMMGMPKLCFGVEGQSLRLSTG